MGHEGVASQNYMPLTNAKRGAGAIRTRHPFFLGGVGLHVLLTTRLQAQGFLR